MGSKALILIETCGLLCVVFSDCCDRLTKLSSGSQIAGWECSVLILIKSNFNLLKLFQNFRIKGIDFYDFENGFYFT